MPRTNLDAGSPARVRLASRTSTAKSTPKSKASAKVEPIAMTNAQASAATAPMSAASVVPAEDVFTRGMNPRPSPSTRTDVYIGNGDDSYMARGVTGAEAGKPLAIHYLRTPSAIGVSEELSKLRFFARVDGVDQPMQEFDVKNGNTHDAYGAEFDVDVPADAHGKVEYWFEAETKSGARVWDSKNGANFSVPVVPKSVATVRFDDNWTDAQSADIKRGSSFEIAYDVDRLKNALGDGWYMMGPTFYASAMVSFDGKPAQEFALTNWMPKNDGSGGYDIVVNQPRVQVPDDAKSVSVWFHAATEGDRGMYDSDFGRNYTFAVT